MRQSSVARVVLMAAMAASLAPTRVDEFRACAACGGLGAVFSRSRKARRRGAEAPGAAAPARRKCDACGGTGIVAGAPAAPARADVAVVGGGIGGLAVAVALQHRAVRNSNIQPDFNVRICDSFDASSSAVLRELDESNRFVQKSAESTSI